MHCSQILTSLVLCGAAIAQLPVIATLPHARTYDILCGDQTFDGVYRFVDWNQDGDYDDAGEVAPFYDSGAGSVALGTPTGIAQLENGTVLVCDATSDVIVALRDDNGDGDAQDVGEHWVFFDNSNASGVGLFSMQSLCVDFFGRVFVANGNNGQGGTDGIFLLEDLNSDGDVLDPAEVTSYCDIPNSSGSTGHCNPFQVLIGPDLNVYYCDNGTGGPIAKGLYRLVDGNNDGDCNDPGEWNFFWMPPSTATSPFLGGCVVDADGVFYLAEYAGNSIWRGVDSDLSGTIDVAEENLYYQTSASIWYDMALRDDGALVVGDYQTPGSLTALQDQNQDDDALDAGESRLLYDQTVAANPGARPRSMTLLRAPILSLSPGTVSIGNTTNIQLLTAEPVDLGAVFLSIGVVTPYPLAPWGYGELEVSSLLPLAFGVSGVDAMLTLPFAVPNDPQLVGSLAMQAWCGHGYRFFLTNAGVLTIQ